MAGSGKLFRPSAESSRRDPVSNAQMNGNIMNPPRYAEFGGLENAGRSIKKNTMTIVPPGAGTRREPVSSGG